MSVWGTDIPGRRNSKYSHAEYLTVSEVKSIITWFLRYFAVVFLHHKFILIYYF